MLGGHGLDIDTHLQGGAFRGYGLGQVIFAVESALDDQPPAYDDYDAVPDYLYDEDPGYYDDAYFEED